MDTEKVIERAERNIRQALADYRAHTSQTEVLDDISDEFIMRLAQDSTRSKQELRELFSKSPVWCEELDALVINGTRTHDPDYSRIESLAQEILWKPMQDPNLFPYVERVIRFFSRPDLDAVEKKICVAAINEIAPKAYTPTKKLSRVFKAICVALSVADETAGSEFQHLYAQFADELTARKIGFKLYASINPAHFLTMSNPKNDRRGNCLTSCHSLNSTDYDFNNGCSGYARDKYTFITFTVDDPSNSETLNNRKTTRQLFMYKPGNGLLLQSRMYNTSGGVYGAAEDSKLYRDLVQREISMLEGMPNLWKTCKFYGSDFQDEGAIWANSEFGGYQDWIHGDFDARISVRNDHADDYEGFEVGAAGLCICCGCEISKGLYCGNCTGGGMERCDCCDEYVDETYGVHTGSGGMQYVCEDCRNANYTECEDCGEYYPNDDMCMTHDGLQICPNCRNRHYVYCEHCDELYHEDDVYTAYDRPGHEVQVCGDCFEEHYERCHVCDEYHLFEGMNHVVLKDGSEVWVCDDCASKYEECPHCGDMIEMCDDGTCPSCGAVITESDEDENGEEKIAV